jgi:hypothetical protein
VAKAPFTYETRSLDQDPVGVEDYVVRTSDGDSAGTVAALLVRDDERFLVVESGAAPVAPARRALPWSAVERVDHDAVAVWLRLDRSSLEREALELDPELAVEEGEGTAEARRVDETPVDLIPSARSGTQTGPVDRPLWANLLALFAAFAFSVLVTVVVITFTGDNTWALLFLVPAALAVALAAVGYRMYRSPYERRAARKP